ncbi:MAG: DUF2808 domain-containing protein [Halothece sp.]
MGVPWLRLSLLMLALLGVSALKGYAGQRPDGTVFFDAPPRLEKAKTTFNETHIRGATYYFTLTVPETAGEPLGKLVIEQRGGIDDIPLLLDETRAFVGTPSDKQETLSLSNVSQSEDNRKITVEFTPPIPPATTMTLGLKPRKNPKSDGSYLFGVTAFPSGEIVNELYLGVRRLQFYDRADDNNFREFP